MQVFGSLRAREVIHVTEGVTELIFWPLAIALL